MARAIFHLTLTIVFLVFQFGCVATGVEKRTVDDNESFLRSIEGSEKIVGVVLVNGEHIAFDEDGARIAGPPAKISGVTVVGDTVTEDWHAVQEYRTERPPSLPLNELNKQIVVEVILKADGRRVKFDGKGGRYMPNQKVIAGVEFASKNAVSVGLDHIREIRLGNFVSFDAQRAVPDSTETVAEIVLFTASRVITFDARGGKIRWGEGPTILGRTESGTIKHVPLSEILYANIESVDPGMTFLKVVGGIALIAAAVLLIALATKQSCPFVYSFDGTQFVFDAEPLGGAVSQGLSKTDFSRMEFLKPTDGTYRLFVQNEVPETQMIDRMSLDVLDHPEGTEVVPDERGNYYALSTVEGPSSVSDESGKDVTVFMRARDGVSWQTDLSQLMRRQKPPGRHALTFTFPKPAEAREARLVVRGGTATWGSNMIREMLSLRGNKVGDWYRDVDRHGPEYFKLLQFMLREELYVLNVYASSGGSWKHVGYIPGGGPLIHEDRIIPLDLTGFEGDTLVLQVRPPTGFWGIDYVGIAYGPLPVIRPVEVRATGDDNNERSLAAIDSVYRTMPDVGDRFELSYPVPPTVDGAIRTVFLRTSGYYTLHLDTTKVEQTALIARLMSTPGSIVDYSIDRLIEWRDTFARNTLPATGGKR